MSIDSILENPSLKNMILNNSVRDFQGYLSGFSYSNNLQTFAPQELLDQINLETAKNANKINTPSVEPDDPDVNPAEIEAVKTVTSRLLNTTIGAYYVKDILAEANIIDDNLDYKLYGKTTAEGIPSNYYRETFVTLIEGSRLRNLSKSMGPTILRKCDSHPSFFVKDGKELEDSEKLEYADMSDMIAESDRIKQGAYIEKKPIYANERVEKSEKVMTEQGYRRAQAYVKGEISDPAPKDGDYVVKRRSVIKRVIKGYTTKKIHGFKFKRKNKVINQNFNNPTDYYTNLTAVVIKNPIYSMPTRNQNYLTVFFNAISQLDMSMATPFLELVFFNIIPKPRSKEEPENRLNQVAYMRFDSDENLMKMSRFVINPSYVNGKLVINTPAGGLSPEDVNSQMHARPDEDQVEVAYQNVFQSPQTLTNANINRTEDLFGVTAFGDAADSAFEWNAKDLALDPFAPMLSLGSFDVTVSEGGYYAVSSRRASMKLILHDRSRLADITPFVTPGALQKTSVKVTFGWSHPLASPHDREERNNVIANFIDSMRETAYYRLSSSNLRLEGSKIDIDVQMDFMGGREFRQIPSYVGTSQENRELKATFKSIIEYISGFKSSDQGKVHHNLIVIEKAVDSFDQMVDTEKHNDLLNELIKAKEKPADDEIKFRIFKKMTTLIDMFTEEEVENIQDVDEFVKKINELDLSERKIGIPIREARLSQERFYMRLAEITGTVSDIELSETADQEKFKNIKNIQITPDYFSSASSMHYLFEREVISSGGEVLNYSENYYNKLRSPGKKKSKFKRGFVTLGKLIQNLVALPISTKNLYSEIQTLYYPVNSESGGARKHTTASLPISVDRLYEEFDKHRKEGTNFTADFVFKILSNMLQDRNAVCYELYTVNQTVEKELEEKYGFKLKDNKISLNKKGQKAAYQLFKENFLDKKETNYPTLAQITGGSTSDNSQNTPQGQATAQSTQNQRDPRSYEQPMYTNWVSTFRNKGIEKRLEEIYQYDKIGAIADNSSFKIIRLKKDIEPCQVLVPNAEELIESLISLGDIGNPYIKDKRILRLHIYDTQLSPRNGLSFVSEKVTSGQSYLKTTNGTTIDPQDAQTLKGDKIPSNFTGAVDSKTGRLLVTNKASNMIINMPPWLLKKYLKREYPSITYGAVSSVVKSINLSSTTENEIAYGKAVQSWQDQEEGVYSKFIIQQKMDLNIIPSTISLQIMGCPFLKVCGHIYVDTGTNTDMDNVYSVVSFSHSISQGQFTTSVNLALPFAASTSNLRIALANTVATLGDVFKSDFDKGKK